LVWPTPNTAYFEGKPIEAYVQATASGIPESGLFGCARSGGQQFHEGLDLKPVKRDARGEPLDDIFSAMPGVVRHINPRAGESNYGRYIVIEHAEVQPPVYSLYAHLSAVLPGLKVGDVVKSGQVIATMGRTSGGGTIPRERAHLHFEIGLLATRQFQSWYKWKKFGSPNEQGLYNGMNLMGLDPVDFYDQFRSRRVTGFGDYFAQMPAVVRVRVATTFVPDLVQRYPQLLTSEVPVKGVAGWEIKVSATGLPFSWKPLAVTDVLGYRVNEVRLSEIDTEALRSCRCKSIALLKGGKYSPGIDLTSMLQLVLGLR
jgi:murein DD-endopeptidase MepM/ murein hydrolase activator NlpD